MIHEKQICILLNIFSVLHIIEEYLLPGGFGREFKQMALKVNLNISNTWLVTTNIMFLAIVISTMFIENKMFCLSIISIAFLNGLLHIGKSIDVKRYFPGLYTAMLLYIPLGAVSFFNFDLTLTQKILSLLTGLLMHLFPFLLLKVSFKRHQ